MTVEELIEELKKFPPNMEVRVWDDYDCESKEIHGGVTYIQDFPSVEGYVVI